MLAAALHADEPPLEEAGTSCTSSCSSLLRLISFRAWDLSTALKGVLTQAWPPRSCRKYSTTRSTPGVNFLPDVDCLSLIRQCVTDATMVEAKMLAADFGMSQASEATHCNTDTIGRGVALNKSSIKSAKWSTTASACASHTCNMSGPLGNAPGSTLASAEGVTACLLYTSPSPRD